MKTKTLEDAQQRFLVSFFVLLFAGALITLSYGIVPPWIRSIETDLWISSVLFYLFRFVVLIRGNIRG